MRNIIKQILILAGLFLVETASAQSVALLGDSNTWLGGDDCQNMKGWSYWFVKSYRPENCKSYARSGATWTCTAKTQCNIEENIDKLGDNNVVYNQIQRLIADKTAKPDIIIIALGTNDLWFNRQHPYLFMPTKNDVSSKDFLNIEPNKLLTLEDCANFAVKTLRKHYPKAAIVFITPAASTHYTQAANTRFAQALEDLGNKLDVPTIRLDKTSPIDINKEKRKKNYTTDGTHTSELGAKAHGTIISNALKALLKN